MSTKRKQIRQYLAQVLKGKTAAGDNVFDSRARKLFESEMPAILVYTSDEKISVFNASPRELQRVLSVKIEVAAQGGDELDDTLDDIAEQIESVMREEQTLNDYASDVVLTQAQTEISAEGEQSSGGCVLTYDVTYYTDDVSTGAVDNRNFLHDFERAHVDMKPTPSTDDSPIASSTIEFEV